MASQPEVSEISSTFERLIRNRDMTIFLPFIFGFSNNLQRRDLDQQQEEQDQSNNHQNNNNNNNNNRVILINPFTQGMVVIEGASSLDSLLRGLGGNKEAQPPAARSAIEAMPRVEITEDCGQEECVICLEEFGVGEFAKEMPCKHKFHENCIEKWLGIHGSCPVCRHKMPVDEEGTESKRRVEREIWVSFSFSGNGGGRSGGDSQDSNQSPSSDDDDDSSDRGEV